MFTIPGAQRPRQAHSWGGFATFSGVLAMVSVPRARLSALLPPPLSCGVGRGADEHPLLVIFGEMSAGGGYLSDFQIPTRISYREVALLVPLVEHPASAGPALFPLCMFADDLRPVFLGNACYGLRKELADIDWRGPRYQVTQHGHAPFSASGATEGSWSKLAASGGSSPASAFELPIVGRRDNGSYVRFAFAWDFSACEARGFVGEVSLAAPELGPSGSPQRDAKPWLLRCDGPESLAVRGLLWRTTAARALGL